MECLDGKRRKPVYHIVYVMYCVKKWEQIKRRPCSSKASFTLVNICMRWVWREKRGSGSRRGDDLICYSLPTRSLTEKSLLKFNGLSILENKQIFRNISNKKSLYFQWGYMHRSKYHQTSCVRFSQPQPLTWLQG